MSKKEYILVLISLALVCTGVLVRAARADEVPECNIPRQVDIVCRQVRHGITAVVQCVDRRGEYFEFVRSDGVS